MILEQCLKYFHTVRYLKARQVFSRVTRRFKKVNTTPVVGLVMREQTQSFKPVRLSKRSMCENGHFVFLNNSGALTDWNDLNRSKLWLYNLHYFDDLNSNDASMRANQHKDLIQKWIEDNPPVFGNGWEPYPISLRIVNWIKFFLGHGHVEQFHLSSLSIQSKVLMQTLETHLLGNHLFANAKALVFAGLFFRGEEADTWLAKGLKILQTEIPEQILGDGGHFELSVMYHATITADMLDLLSIIEVFNDDRCDALQACVKEYLPKMLSWLEVMSHPDGDCSFFNDTAIGIAPFVAQLLSTAKVFGIQSAIHSSNSETFNYLTSSGYFRLNLQDAVVLGDVGRIGPDYIPGHAHADTLSFELSVFGERFIVNSGTSVYDKGSERLRQRGTAAHSTVVIDGKNSSEVWGGFRVARRASPFGFSRDTVSQTIRCAHDGYLRLPGKPVHTREWVHSNSSLVVRDTVTGEFKTAEARFHIHPEWRCKLEGNRFTFVRCDCTVSINVKHGLFRLEPSTYHPEFGISIPNSVLVVQIPQKTPVSEIHIQW